MGMGIKKIRRMKIIKKIMILILMRLLTDEGNEVVLGKTTVNQIKLNKILQFFIISYE